MIIYKIENKLDKKVYIGQTIRSLRIRWKEHNCLTKNNCVRLSRAIKKYGKENFFIEQIDSAETIEELNEKELYWIKHFDSTNKRKGYNIESGGGNKILKELIRNKLIERKHPSEYYNWSEHLTGHKKWSNVNYKKPKTDTHRLNISINSYRKRKIVQLNLDGSFVEEFDSLKSATLKTGFKSASISACLNKRAKTSNKYIFIYKEDYEANEET